MLSYNREEKKVREALQQVYRDFALKYGEIQKLGILALFAYIETKVSITFASIFSCSFCSFIPKFSLFSIDISDKLLVFCKICSVLLAFFA